MVSRATEALHAAIVRRIGQILQRGHLFDTVNSSPC